MEGGGMPSTWHSKDNVSPFLLWIASPWTEVVCMICGAIPVAGVGLWAWCGTRIWEWTSLSSVSILLLFISPSLRFLTIKWICTETLPNPFTPLHSKMPVSAKLTPRILSVFRLLRKRSHMGWISWSSWYHSMIGLGLPLIGQLSLTTSSSSATYFSAYPSSTIGGPGTKLFH